MTESDDVQRLGEFEPDTREEMPSLELDEEAMRPVPRSSSGGRPPGGTAPVPAAPLDAPGIPSSRPARQVALSNDQAPVVPGRAVRESGPRSIPAPTSRAPDSTGMSFATRVYVTAGVVALVFGLLIGGRILLRRFVNAAATPGIQTYELARGEVTLSGPARMQACPFERPNQAGVEGDCRFSTDEQVAIAAVTVTIPPGASVSLPAITEGMRGAVAAELSITRETWTELGNGLVRKITGRLREHDGWYEFRAYVLVNQNRLFLILVEGKEPMTPEREEWMESMLTSVVIRR